MTKNAAKLASACLPIIETLEDRRLMSASTIQTLPFRLEFDSDKGELVDKDGQGTGFTRVQANKLGNEYQASLIDLNTQAGVLVLTTAGTSVNGSNSKGDNTLVNALETQFNATTSGFEIITRLLGPMSYIDTPSEQGGIMFGPDHDNWVKLVAVAQPSGQFVQFIDEQTTNGVYSSSLTGSDASKTYTNVGSFAGISTLDLRLVGDGATGKVLAYYAVNGGSWVKITQELTLSGSKKTAFFTSAARAGIIALHKNDVGPAQVTFDRFEVKAGTPLSARPSVTASRPANGDIGVRRDAFVAADVNLPTPGAGVDTATLNSNTVKLYRTSDNLLVSAILNTSGGGDAIVLTPMSLLDANTNYTFEVTANLKDTAGAAFNSYKISFTTGTTGGEVDSSMAFEKVAIATASGKAYTSLKIGPDGKLYAGTIDGLIQRFTINSDGTLGAAQNITSLQQAEGGQRFLIGMAFDPSSTAGDLILWVSHGQYAFEGASDWTGKITKLSGSNLATVQHAVINLPRAVRDHLTNQITFGPDGALYIPQGSNTAMGAPDNAWGLRPERMLSGAILRLDVTKVGSSPIDVKTEDGGTYNPWASNAPLTIYASGVRNAYELLWHSNGHLYAPTNGSAAGGSTPATPAPPINGTARIDYDINGPYTGPSVPGLTNVQETQNDYLFRIVEGGFYGHPNPLRFEFVLNGGNPTSGVDSNEVASYPVGTLPDRNYRGAAYNFGTNYSPNGIIEYKGNAFGGALDGKLMVVRYSGGDDIIILTPGANGDIVSTKTGIAGLTHFNDPLDLAVNPSSGFIYVAEYGGQKITLLRPITPGANATVDKDQMVFNDTTATGSSPNQTITITNTGTSVLAIPSGGISIGGTDASRFAIAAQPTLPASIQPGESVQVQIKFTAGSVKIYTAKLVLQTNDPDNPTLERTLRGIGAAGIGGANEPSLQRVLDLYQIPVTVGDSDPLDVYLDEPPVQPNDEIEMPILLKAGAGPITIEPIAVFGVGSSSKPTLRFGTYTPGNRFDKKELFSVSGQTNAQSVNPTVNGTLTLDPGSSAFGIYATWPTLGDNETFTEDRLNFFDAQKRKVRFYPLKTPEGAVVPNAFIIAFEEFNAGYDNQDFVAIIRNVKAAPAGPEIGFENLDGVPFSDRLTFSRIQNPDPINPNGVHDEVTLRVRNTGTQDLVINSMTISSQWLLVSPPSTPITIAAGQHIDLEVRFVATSGGLVNGQLVLNTNDADEPNATIQLSGFWQIESENNKEPNLTNIVTAFGYGTVITRTGEVLNQGGLVARVGDEVLSAYWKRADSSLPATMRQLVAYHTQNSTAFFKYHTKGSNTQTELFSHEPLDGQSILPRLTNSSNPAQGSFSHTGTFGFRIDSEWSDPAKNTQEQTGGGYGHHVRLFVARDRDGKLIPNTYIITMDYLGINYDYQDNMYLVTNVMPESPPAAPAGLTASASGAGIALNWNDSTEGNLAGYNVYRSDAPAGTYTKLNAALLSGSDYLDIAAPTGVPSYYRVTTVNVNGNESSASTASATRIIDSTPPAAPSGLTMTGSLSGISLDWSNNTEADLAGYNVYRANSFSGTYVKLNSGVLTSSAYFDSAAPSGDISYYRVTAVDLTGNESAAATGNASRPSPDSTAPATPASLTATGSLGGVSLDWTNNVEADLAGYNVYRSSSEFGTYTMLNTDILTASQFSDTTAPSGVTSYYRVTAVDSSGNESLAATTSAIRTADTTAPAQPANLTASGSASGIALDWNDNIESDLAGYNVYRASSLDGTYTKLNTSLLSSSTYDDTAAPGGASSYYRVTAVDSVGNESSPGSASADRPAIDTAAPSAPMGISAASVPGGVQLNWLDNIEPDLAGYYVYRSATPSGGFVKLNTTPISAAQYFDAAAPAGTSYYQVTAVDVSGNESSPATANATRIATYTGVNINNPTPTGSHTTLIEESDYDIRGGGANINGTSDSFYFVYRQLSGDFDMRVRVDGLTNAQDFAKAGLMARESLTDNSRNAYIHGTPGVMGNRFSFRANSGGDTTIRVADGPVVYPNNWLRLQRVGNAFSGYKSTDGMNWTLVSSASISMPQTVFFGMAVTSKHTSKLATGNFRALGSLSSNPPPGVPGSATASGATNGITLDWANNSESDLAGYNVYRASSANGTYTKLNASLLSGSNYFDSTAPAGFTNYYRITAVDTATNESAPASLSAFRPGTDSTPPSTPINLSASGSSTTITLDWSDNTEEDIAGYNVYRSSSSGGTYTKLNSSVLTSSAYNDLTAPAGATSYYGVTAVDTAGNESTAAAANAARPAAIGGPIKINFQLEGSPLVNGYNPDYGKIFDDRGNGLTYGWSNDHTSLARDRNKKSNQLLDTLVHIRAGQYWAVELANGAYDVTVSIGDAYASTHTLNVNNMNYWTDKSLAANVFNQKTMTVQVTNGYLWIDCGSGASESTRINYVEITPVVRINFQQDGSQLVAGYLPDFGEAYGNRGNGLTYGWSSDHTEMDRDRDINGNQLLDTLVHMKSGSTWELELPNGSYSVTVSVGDAQYATTQTLNVNGVSFWSSLNLAVNDFAQKTLTVQVTSGRLILDCVGGINEGTRLNYLEVRRLS